MSSGIQYVVAAHAIIVVAALIYGAHVVTRTARIRREAELLRRLQRGLRAPHPGGAAESPQPAPVGAPPSGPRSSRAAGT